MLFWGIVFTCYLISSRWNEARNHGWYPWLWWMRNGEPYFHVENSIHTHNSTKIGHKEPGYKRASLLRNPISKNKQTNKQTKKSFTELRQRACELVGYGSWHNFQSFRWVAVLISPQVSKAFQASTLWAEKTAVRALGWVRFVNDKPCSILLCFTPLWTARRAQNLLPEPLKPFIVSNFFHLPLKNKRKQPGADQWGLGPQLLQRSAAQEIGFKYVSVVLGRSLLLQIGHTTRLN